ncbi:serine protease inhibitor swm-1-like [Rhinoderma darwinii]|uniref:serine protease inhibitor swm-1-like n=1 Tax=Rhinoderma darwinii TaxID=43563 RepID=UPI003F663559
MARTSVVLLSFLSVLLMLIPVQGVGYDAETCEDDKVYNECGSACPPTCNCPPRPCILMCVRGCFCKEGTIDNGYGECVTIENCKSCSGIGNTTYAKCYTDCNQSCPTLSKPNLCETACSKGCRCKPGYVRLSGSRSCVLPKDCPKT